MFWWKRKALVKLSCLKMYGCAGYVLEDVCLHSSKSIGASSHNALMIITEKNNKLDSEWMEN